MRVTNKTQFQKKKYAFNRDELEVLFTEKMPTWMIRELV